LLDSLILSASQKAFLTEAANRYAKTVDSAAAFLQGRAVTRDTAISRLLGCVSDPAPGHERFDGWLSIPYVTPSGVVAIKFRCIRHEDCKAEGCQRYDAPAGQKAKLYGAGDLVNGGDVAAVVEGEFKAIAVTQALGIPAVSTSAGQWMEHWPRTLADFDRVLVIADNDDAGLKHAKDKVLKSLPQGRLVVPPSEYPKVDDWLLEAGADEVRRAIGLV